jgi:hypothetical protein
MPSNFAMSVPRFRVCPFSRRNLYTIIFQESASVLVGPLVGWHSQHSVRARTISSTMRRRPELTDRALAKLALADHKTVAAGRAKAEASGEIPHIPPAERVEADGRKSRARRTPSEAPDWDEIVPPDWRPVAGLRFLSPVKPSAPKGARIIAARAYIAWLGLTVDELIEAHDRGCPEDDFRRG